MQGHFWRQFLNKIFMLFHMVAFILVSMATTLITYFKDSDWLLNSFDQQESGWKSYHGQQNRDFLVKEHEKLYKKKMSKVTLHFVWGHLSRKQTVAEASRGPLKGTVSAQKALQRSETETRELQGGTEENSVSPMRGSLICPPGKSMIFLQKRNRNKLS